MSIKKIKPVYLGLAIALFSFIIYLLTLSPAVPYRDSGELITAAHVLGNAHPPGFPLYLVTGKLFSVLPFGVARSINLMSAVFAALTVMLVFLITLKVAGETVPAAAAALALAFSRVFWSQALQAEVFAMNVFFAALLIYIVLHREVYGRSFYLVCFIFSLGLCNHHSLVLLAPALVYILLDTRKQKGIDTGFLIKGFLFVLLGLSLYLYLPVRAAKSPPLNWNNPVNLERVISVIMRKDYGTLRLNQEVDRGISLAVMGGQVKEYIISMARQFTLPVFLAGIIGCVALFRRKKLWVFTALAFIFSGPFFVFLANMPLDENSLAIIERFYGLPAIIFSIWVGLGIIAIARKLGIKHGSIILGGLLAVLPLAVNYSHTDMSRNYLAHDYGEDILSSLPQNSIMFTRRDNTRNLMWYMKFVEKKRPDVKLVVVPLPFWWTDRLRESGLLLRINEFNEADVKAIIKDNQDSFPICGDNLEDKDLGKFYDNWLPSGIAFRFVPEGRTSVAYPAIRELNGKLDKYTIRNDYDKGEKIDTFSREVIHYYAEAHFNYGAIYHNRGYYEDAMKEFGKAIEIDPLFDDARKLFEIDRKLVAGRK